MGNCNFKLLNNKMIGKNGRIAQYDFFNKKWDYANFGFDFDTTPWETIKKMIVEGVSLVFFEEDSERNFFRNPTTCVGVEFLTDNLIEILKALGYTQETFTAKRKEMFD